MSLPVEQRRRVVEGADLHLHLSGDPTGFVEPARLCRKGGTMIVESFTRIFVEHDALDRTIAFYSRLLSGQVTMRFAYPNAGLELAAVSSDQLSVLIIAGKAHDRAPFEATRLTIKVERLEPTIAILAEAGCEQLEPIQKTPVGRKTRFRHADGTTVEYVDHDEGAIRRQD